jgi:hypothetical protein
MTWLPVVLLMLMLGFVLAYVGLFAWAGWWLDNH